MRAFTTAALVIASATLTQSHCTLRDDAVVAVYANTGAGGAGDNSVAWTRAFFSWFAAPNPALVVDFVTDAAEIAAYPAGGGCALTSFRDLALWVQPGGSADNFSASLGPGGRDNILDFAASAQGHYMGTCAGFYYAAGTYWWYDAFYPEAWMPHFFPTVEGPVKAIAAYPAYAPVALDDGRNVLYWGGPVLGLNHTTASIPDGATVLASYDTPLLAAPLAAAYRYRGTYVNALFSSAHPEAVAGSGIACEPPLPAGCLTSQQQLANWQWLANEINDLLGAAFIVPTSL